MAIFRIIGAIFLGLALIVDGSNGGTCIKEDSVPDVNDMISKLKEVLLSSDVEAAGNEFAEYLASDVVAILIGSEPVIGRDAVIANFKEVFGPNPLTSYTSTTTAIGCNDDEDWEAWAYGTEDIEIADQQFSFAWEFLFKKKWCVWPWCSRRNEYLFTHIIRYKFESPVDSPADSPADLHPIGC